MKQGLFFEDDGLYYYKNGQRHHAGVVKVDGAIYYIGSGGKAVKGRHIVHGEMANDILKRGTYTFGEDYKLVKGSYKAPKKHKKKKKLFAFLKKKKTDQKKRSRASRRKFKLDKKGKKKLAILSGSFAVMLVLVIVVSVNENWLHGVILPGIQAPSGTKETINNNARVDLPDFSDEVLLCSSAAKQEYDGILTLKEAVKVGDPYRPFLFNYQIIGASGKLYISEDPRMINAQEYFMPESDTAVSIDNLKVSTTYYYHVVVGDQTYVGSFRTAESTRFVYIPGLINTRDIGGGTTLDGKTVRQALLIRGVELDGLVNQNYFIPTDSLEAVRDSFGFVYDMDLRYSGIYTGEYTSRLNIPHKFYGAPQYGQIFMPEYHDSLRQIFADLANPANYPMYLHCTWGTDRTGTVIFLLQGVLNMSEEDMVREYRLTSYISNTLADSSNMEIIINGLQPYKGDTLQEKIVTYLTSVIGVTEDELDIIRKIFLEG